MGIGSAHATQASDRSFGCYGCSTTCGAPSPGVTMLSRVTLLLGFHGHMTTTSK